MGIWVRMKLDKKGGVRSVEQWKLRAINEKQ
jgi:hypothetical protein